jgi:hypothetical protein
MNTDIYDYWVIVTPAGFIDPRRFPSKELAERVVASWVANGGYEYWKGARVVNLKAVLDAIEYIAKHPDMFNQSINNPITYIVEEN